MTADSLYDYVKARILPKKRMYLFFDEIQRVPKWEDAINAFRVDFDADIYVTGSNAYMLSSEYTTLLAGRCIEIKVLPLSFSEFLTFLSLSQGCSGHLPRQMEAGIVHLPLMRQHLFLFNKYQVR